MKNSRKSQQQNQSLTRAAVDTESRLKVRSKDLESIQRNANALKSAVEQLVPTDDAEPEDTVPLGRQAFNLAERVRLGYRPAAEGIPLGPDGQAIWEVEFWIESAPSDLKQVEYRLDPTVYRNKNPIVATSIKNSFRGSHHIWGCVGTLTVRALLGNKIETAEELPWCTLLSVDNTFRPARASIPLVARNDTGVGLCSVSLSNRDSPHGSATLSQRIGASDIGTGRVYPGEIVSLSASICSSPEKKVDANDRLVPFDAQAMSIALRALSKELLIEVPAAVRSEEEARSLWQQGYEAYRAGRIDQANKMYRDSIKTDPSYAPAHNSLGRIAFEEHKPAQAEKLFLVALEHDNEYAPALHNLALLEYRRNSFAKALNYADQALALKRMPATVELREKLTQVLTTDSSPAGTSKAAHMPAPSPRGRTSAPNAPGDPLSGI